ncbi:4Fe-4S dicluster domain-containing protein [Arenibacter sp. GZD96]|uniref:4Fe-4S dicluster domain-containing protein n=1 Tax=Aurantibrevibacter litoralis TaxID=3106030 RepID=UPI002AFF25AD|nr:4Fe-4S dicluster domain-containing protein [Arenibacter sp. GZD-96]MEA1786546.1 4Fe-4S dicluster domain-containing protein [Arenibacter sp. GZD-96]
MIEDKKTTRRNFFDIGIKFGLFATVGTVAAVKALEKEPSPSGMVELMSTDGNIVQVPASEVHEYHHTPVGYDPREGFPNKKFVMVVDLAKCKNALKCQSACNKGHYITGDNAWLKVYKMQESEKTAPYFMPTQCQHCDKPPCVKVCPVDATFKRKDGIVLIDNERCIGCRFCMAACPYSTRVFNWNEPEQPEMVQEEPYTPDYCGKPSIKGTVDKCDFCPHQTLKGELPFCVSACPNDVFSFGDLYEDVVTNGSGQTVKLSTLLKDRAGHRLLESLGTEPSVYYLPPVDRLVEFEEGMENYNEFQSVDKTETL